MTAITATMVKDLREKTGAGMMDCKAALNETNGDMEAAVDWLRAKGLAKAAKKAGRVAAEGLIGLAAGAKAAALVEVNSETDFVARNDEFQELVAHRRRPRAEGRRRSRGARQGASWRRQGQRRRSFERDDRHDRREHDAPPRRAYLAVKNGAVATYMHNTIAPGLGKIGVIVALESTGDAATLNGLGKQVAMHIAAANPLAIDVANLDPALVERERASSPSRRRSPASPRPSSRRWSRAACANSTRRSCCLQQAFVHRS